MSRPAPADAKLIVFASHSFSHWRPPVELADEIRRRWPDMRVLHISRDDDLLTREIPDADIFVGLRLRPQQFAAARRLKWIHCTAAGVSQYMYPEIRESGVSVTNASGVHAIPMAEHVVGMMIALSHHFPEAMRYQMRSQWAQQEIWDGPARPVELLGQVALLVGFGAVGRAVAERLQSLGMNLWAVTRSGQADPALASRVFPASELNSALAGADFVIIAAPHTPETRHLIGERQLAAMKTSAFLINVARGSLIDEAALVAALQSGRIAGGSLDVMAEEPLPPSSPLWQLPNLLITPHTSGVSSRLWERESELLLDNLNRWFAGQPLRNLVDLTRGY
jgi:phosphoglycerate dehydrogenase-like enzyme